MIEMRHEEREDMLETCFLQFDIGGKSRLHFSQGLENLDDGFDIDLWDVEHQIRRMRRNGGHKFGDINNQVKE